MNETILNKVVKTNSLQAKIDLIVKKLNGSIAYLQRSEYEKSVRTKLFVDTVVGTYIFIGQDAVEAVYDGLSYLLDNGYFVDELNEMASVVHSHGISDSEKSDSDEDIPPESDMEKTPKNTVVDSSSKKKK